MRGMVVLAIAAGCGRFGFGDRTGSSDAPHDVGGDAPGDAACVPASSSTWALQQVNGAFTPSGVATLSVPVVATKAGDLIVVAVQGEPPGTATSVTDVAGSSYTRVANTLGVDATGGDNVELWYTPSAVGGSTQINATFPTLTYAIVAWEFQTPVLATVDTGSALSNQAATTSPEAPAITTHCGGELVIAAAIAEGSITEIAGGNPFTNDETTNDNGWAHITDPHAPAGTYTAVWSSNSGVYCSSAAAFIVE